MKYFIMVCMFVGWGTLAVAKDVKKPESMPAQKASGDYVVGSSTSIDFSEAQIEGQFKAPQGFFLQGNQQQSLSQMVRLRSNFRNELRSSKGGVRAIVK